MKTVHRITIALTLLYLPLLSAQAIDFNPDFPPTGEGGTVNGQDFTVGAGGSVFELDAFVNIAGQDLNGPAFGTSAQLSMDPLPAGLDFTFSSQLSADQTDLTLTYTFTNNTGSDIVDFKFLSFVDVDIDESVNTFFNEFAEIRGTPEPGQNFEVDEPGFVFGDIFNNLLAGQLDGTNALPIGNPDDVAMALAVSIAIAPEIPPGADFAIQIMISEDEDSLEDSSFSIVQRDSDPSSTTTITFSSSSLIPPSIPFPCPILGDQSVKLGKGTGLRKGTDAPTVCSNGEIITGANVAVHDLGDVLQAYDDGSSLLGGSVKFGNGVHVNGNVRANGDIRFSAKNRVALNAHAGLDLILRRNTVVNGECRYGNNLIDSGLFNSCGSEIVDPTPPFANTFDLPTCDVTAPGGQDIGTRPNVSYGPLPAGDYGQVNFGNGNRVELCGEYTFEALSFGTNTRIDITCPIKLEVEERLVFHNGVKQVLSSGVRAQEIVYFVHSDMGVEDAHGAGVNTKLYGTICGPRAKIKIGNGTAFEGALVGKIVGVGDNVKFTASPAPLP